MTSVKEQEAIRKLMVFLRERDSAHKREYPVQTSTLSKAAWGTPQWSVNLSLALSNSYVYSTCLNKLLKSIGIFLSAASGHRYLLEFLEVGSVVILLEILGLNHLKQEDKRESVKLLQLVADAGRKYKELICESYGVQSLAAFLAASDSAEAQEDVQVLLDSLGHGNPKYQNQVYKGLVADMVGEMASALVEPVLGVLCSVHLEVQYEAIQLLKGLLAHQVRPTLLKGLVALLTPPGKKSLTFCDETSKDPTTLCLREPVLVYVQQAAAAKAIRVLAKESAEVAEELIQLEVVHGLMVAVGNLDHVASQRQASISLEYFVHMFPFVEECVKKALGHTLFQRFTDSPETWYTEMDPVQAEELTSNTVDIPRDMARMQSAGVCRNGGTVT
ncbi:unnamed protein product [Bubo scandiacus]